MDSIQLCTFYINDHLFGIEVDKIQEVIKNHQISSVSFAPEFVGGLIHVRGQSILSIDLKDKMSLPQTCEYSRQMNIVLRHNNSLISLLVDSVGDVISVFPDQIDVADTHLPGGISNLISGIFQTETDVLMVLNPEQLNTL